MTYASDVVAPERFKIFVLVYLCPTNTKSLAKEFSEILIFEYFLYLKMGVDVFGIF